VDVFHSFITFFTNPTVLRKRISKIKKNNKIFTYFSYNKKKNISLIKNTMIIYENE
jgi:hypothetical protein